MRNSENAANEGLANYIFDMLLDDQENIETRALHKISAQLKALNGCHSLKTEEKARDFLFSVEGRTLLKAIGIDSDDDQHMSTIFKDIQMTTKKNGLVRDPSHWSHPKVKQQLGQQSFPF